MVHTLIQIQTLLFIISFLFLILRRVPTIWYLLLHIILFLSQSHILRLQMGSNTFNSAFQFLECSFLFFSYFSFVSFLSYVCLFIFSFHYLFYFIFCYFLFSSFFFSFLCLSFLSFIFLLFRLFFPFFDG